MKSQILHRVIFIVIFSITEIFSFPAGLNMQHEHPVSIFFAAILMIAPLAVAVCLGFSLNEILNKRAGTPIFANELPADVLYIVEACILVGNPQIPDSIAILRQASLKFDERPLDRLQVYFRDRTLVSDARVMGVSQEWMTVFNHSGANSATHLVTVGQL